MPNDSEFKADIISQTAAQWTAINPFLGKNDLGIETDTGRCKAGVGLKWSDTSYIGPPCFTGTVVYFDVLLDDNQSLTFTNGVLVSKTQYVP